MSADEEPSVSTDTSESDDLTADQAKAAASRHPDNKWEARAQAAAEKAEAAPAEPEAGAAAEPEAVETVTVDDEPADEHAAAEPAKHTSRAREALASQSAADIAAPPIAISFLVSALGYLGGVVAGWAVALAFDASPWPVAFAGVIGGVIGFLLARALLRGYYGLRS